MGSGLLGRIARHGHSPLRTPREDRLTDVFAAVVGSMYCRDLARYVVLDWMDPARDQGGAGRWADCMALLADAERDWSCHADTQVPITVADQARRPDLILRFTARDQRQINIWVEVKHGTGPHSDQLQAYLDRHTAEGVDGGVVLLAPRGDFDWFVEDQVPPGVLCRDWQRTAAAVSIYETDDVIGQFLATELATYLREERLMDPTLLTADHLKALAVYREAREGLMRVCELAAADIAKRRAAVDADSYGGEHWWTYEWKAGPARLRETAPGWELFDAGSLALTDGSPAPLFVVGFGTEVPVTTLLGDGALDRLQQQGFRILRTYDTAFRNNKEYVWKTVYADELLNGPASLREQGAALANWAQEGLDALEAALAAATTDGA